MGTASTLGDKIGQWGKKKVEEEIKEAPKEVKKEVAKKVTENVWARVVTWLTPSEENQNRLKALTRLWDIAESGTKAVGSCTVAAGAGAAEVGTDGAATPVAAPVGMAAWASCTYNGAKTVDSGQAMVRQIWTGKETKTFEEEGKEAIGAWVKKKASDELEREVHEALTADERKFLQDNPGANHWDYVHMQDLQDSFDDGTAFDPQ